MKLNIEKEKRQRKVKNVVMCRHSHGILNRFKLNRINYSDERHGLEGWWKVAAHDSVELQIKL